LVSYKDGTENESKSSQCLKKNSEKTFRKPGELLLETTLKDYKKVWLLGSKI